jgi:type IV fimbrial biogenesis protein FimT
VNKPTQSVIYLAPHKRQCGFTLVELLVALAIAAVLLTLGVPSFRSTIASSRLTSSTSDLVGSLAQARSEAIRRGVRVTVCISNDGATCATSGNWDRGWISFVDITRSETQARVDDDENIISVTQRGVTSTLIEGSTDPARGGPDIAQYVSFSSDGTARKMSGMGPGGGILRLCEPSNALTDANRAREIEVAAVGRLSTTTPLSVAATCPAP